MKRFAFIVSTLLIPLVAHAEIDEVYSPLVTKGTMEVEYKGVRLGDSGKALENSQSHEVEMNYGLTNDLRIGLIGQGQRSAGEPFHSEGFGAQVLYTTTHQGDWWLSSGVLGEYVVANHDNSPDSLEGRVLLSRVQGPFTFSSNLIFGRELGHNHSSGVGFGASAQALYDIGNEHFTPGIEWYGDFGKLNRFGDESSQQHYVGPILTGEIAEFGNSGIEYSAGYYWGLTNSSADHGARIELDYELKF